MGRFTTAIFLAGLATVEAAKCRNLTIPITASARNGVFEVPTPTNNIEVTNLIISGNVNGVNGSAEALQGYATVSGNYTISATYCEPNNGPANVLQILTAGLGFDKTYWNLAYNNYNYSYTNVAVDQYGYSTFAYDRLGMGDSSHGDPINEIQGALEIDALRALTVGLQQGSFNGINATYGKIVHIGHSYGSLHTYALTAKYPNISNGIVLTGFAQDLDFVQTFSFALNLGIANKLTNRFKAYPNGYLAGRGQSYLQYGFLAPGQFDPKILPYLYNGDSPVTIGELLTLSGEANTGNGFAGPVLIATGQRDVVFCGGNCTAAPAGYPNIPSTSAQYIPNAKPFQVDIIPGAGHGLNLQYSAKYTYNTINTFLGQNGLKASPQ